MKEVVERIANTVKVADRDPWFEIMLRMRSVRLAIRTLVLQHVKLPSQQ